MTTTLAKNEPNPIDSWERFVLTLLFAGVIRDGATGALEPDVGPVYWDLRRRALRRHWFQRTECWLIVLVIALFLLYWILPASAPWRLKPVLPWLVLPAIVIDVFRASFHQMVRLRNSGTLAHLLMTPLEPQPVLRDLRLFAGRRGVQALLAWIGTFEVAAFLETNPAGLFGVVWDPYLFVLGAAALYWLAATLGARMALAWSTLGFPKAALFFALRCLIVPPALLAAVSLAVPSLALRMLFNLLILGWWGWSCIEAVRRYIDWTLIQDAQYVERVTEWASQSPGPGAR
ncbi:MAG: hypothetical protein NTW86_23155 [Candidatus Sumerlaeota bacterium]|nr:hypothetical protein [Candidatus Sumerlaeota bacterium]